MSASGQWYVITIRRSPAAPFTVQVSQKPFPSGSGVTALEDSGPYATKAAAQAAAGKLKNATVPGAFNNANIPQNVLFGAGGVPTVLRIAEMLLGIVLIGIGLARITGTQNAISQVVKARIP